MGEKRVFVVNLEPKLPCFSENMLHALKIRLKFLFLAQGILPYSQAGS